MKTKLRNKNKLPIYSFVHSSYMGSFSIQCRIIYKSNTKWCVEFIDPCTKELRIRFLSPNDICKERP